MLEALLYRLSGVPEMHFAVSPQLKHRERSIYRATLIVDDLVAMQAMHELSFVVASSQARLLDLLASNR